MGKIIGKKEKNLIKSLLTYIIFIVGIIVLLFVIPTVLPLNETIMQYYIPFAVVFFRLVMCFLGLKLFYRDKPKFKDGKYVWKDGRVYEGDWDKRYGANGKGKLTWADGSYYEGDFKKGHLFGKGKKVSSNGESYEGDWENDKANGRGKLNFPNGSYYEGEFKDGKMDGEGIIGMNSGFSYTGEFREGRAKGKMYKQKFPDGSVIEGSFVCDGFADFTGEGKTTYPKGFVYIGEYKNGVRAGKGKLILQNGEYSEGNRVNGVLTGLARYYFKDGSYYEGESGEMGWQGIGTYVTEKGEEYQTGFPYGIIDVFRYGFSSKIKEIHGNLNYTPKSEKEKIEERDKYLEISEKGTPIQKEIAKIFLDFGVESDNFLESIQQGRNINNYISVFSNMNNFYGSVRKDCKNLLDRHHIKSSSKGLYSYGEFFSRLDLFFDSEIKLGDLMVKIYRFLDPEHVLDFVVKKDQKDIEWIGLINDFSNVYREDIQSQLDWSGYENKFWEHNFKPDKKGK